MDRHCARPTCSDTAVATLTYAYASRRVWLDDLSAEREPSGHDLCPRHAEGQRVPSGWVLEDRRSVPVAAPVRTEAPRATLTRAS